MDTCAVERRFFASGWPWGYNRYQDKWLRRINAPNVPGKECPPTHRLPYAHPRASDRLPVVTAGDRGKPFARPYQLFDLVQDLSEQDDVIGQHPEIASRLEKACAKVRNR